MRIVLLIFVLFLGLQSQSAPKNRQMINKDFPLTMTTFNLKWFGLSGNLWNDPTHTEFRKNYLKRFIDQELPNSDVIVFTEVTNPDLLSEIFSHRFECVTYDRESQRHQRIVTCFNFYKYRVEKYDEDFIIPEVAFDSSGLRPATQMKLCHKKGDCFLQIIGVHLIAGDKSDVRIKQIAFIGDDLKKQTDPLPTIITGDFNSYTQEQSGLKEDDIKAFERTLSSPSRTFKSVNETIKTYGSGEWARVYDHIVVSNEITNTSIRGYQACDNITDLNNTFIPYYSYSRYFSDHCPLTANLILKTK